MNSKEILKMYCKEKYDNEIVIKTYSIQEIVQIIDFTKQLMLGGVVGSPIELQPVLAEMEHINDLGKSTWYEVVYFDGNWRCYAGSKTFKDGERVIKWKYAKDCL